jgi:hypothetical protein
MGVDSGIAHQQVSTLTVRDYTLSIAAAEPSLACLSEKMHTQRRRS